MRAIAVQSGSNGNCVYVEAGSHRLLVDAGISGRRVQQRLCEADCDVRKVDGVFISHDHSDHIAAAGIYQRKFHLPVYVTEKTYHSGEERYGLGPMRDVRHFAAGETVQLNGVHVETIPTPHDAVDGVGFVIDDGEKRLGVLTDLGHVFTGLADIVASLDAVILESNHDPTMLAWGPYPPMLKRRIAGPGGHLSNIEAAELLAHAKSRLKWACLAHLSEENNQPDLAVETHRSIVGDGLPIHVASRYETVGPFEV